MYITHLSPIIPKSIPWFPCPRIWWRRLGSAPTMSSSNYLSCSDKSHLIAPTPKKALKHPCSETTHPLCEHPPYPTWALNLHFACIVTWSGMPNAGCRVRSVSTQERGQAWTHAHPTWAWLGHHALVNCGSPARIRIDSGLCFLIQGFIALEETWDQGV